MSKHTNYVGYKVVVDMEDLMGEDYGIGMVEFPVLQATVTMECDFCTEPGYAEYEVDAESVLGEDAGHNTFYCQTCANLAATSEMSPDEWKSPGMQNLEKMHGAS